MTSLFRHPWLPGMLLIMSIVNVCMADVVPADVRVIDVDKVWAGHRVGFCLLTHRGHQFVAYYDADRRMTVAQRALDSNIWQYTRLDSKVGWDSHNYVTMAVDSARYLHVSGNMHVAPLVYFRSSKSLDSSTLKPIHLMTGQREQRVTYPVFMKGPSGELIFSYRDGASGKGDNLFNVYEVSSQTWKRLIDQPLMDGQGKMNAYMTTPKLGPDGYFHVIWVWRDSYLAETCHDLSYIRSKDLIHWENARGEPLKLPIQYADNSKLVIDPIPSQGGILNGTSRLSFFKDNTVAVTYHKFDNAGNTQLYTARLTRNGWKIYQMTDWDYRWDFAGGGSLPPSEVQHSALQERDGKLTISVMHKKYGRSWWEVDPDTFKLVAKMPNLTSEFTLPPDIRKPVSTFPGMNIRQLEDVGSAENGKVYRLRWETLDANRDRPRPEPWPEPSTLQILEYENHH